MKSLRFFCSLIVLIVAMVPIITHAATPHRVTVANFLHSDSDFASAIVMDVNSKEILFEYNADKPWVPASLTKLVGALVFTERQPAWDAIVALKAEDEVGGGRLRVDDGATMSVQDLMYSAMVGSANNAATAFGRLSGLGMDGFVAAMNRKVRDLGCNVSYFEDLAGMDVDNRTTAREMLKIATASFARAEIHKPASTAEYSFIIRNTGELKKITNTNDLLVKPDNGLYVTGGKTGFLYESLNNLVVRLKPSETDQRELLIVVLGSPSRADMFAITERLAKWSWATYSWEGAPSSAIAEAGEIPNGTLIKKPDSPAVWYIWKGKKYILLDGIFLDHYFQGVPIKTVTADIVEVFTSARPYTFDDGELLKSAKSPVVYYVQHGMLRPISSESAFLSMGWNWNQIVTAPQFVLDTYSQGLAINTLNTDSVLLTSR
ncbi:MAG: serine hydrolase [Patescibacteria group bacterium]|nr:serine hydrolase [Patescibacteria group bacterium]